MPNRAAFGATSRARSSGSVTARRSTDSGSLGGPIIAPRLRRGDAFDTTRPRADGSLFLGRRTHGPGDVVLTKAGDLTLDGKKGPAAAIEVARLIESGVSPFAHATEAQRAHLVKALERSLEAPAASGKNTSTAVMNRSAAATLLLSLARTSSGGLRDEALTAFVGLLSRETHLPFKASMLNNLDAAHLPLKKALAAQVEATRDVVQPKAPPYARWFGSEKSPRLEVRQYVMDDFWKEEIASNKRRGFEIVSEKPNEIVWKRTLQDPAGKAPDTAVNVVMRKQDQDVLRDLDDAKVDFVIYSGHAQLGGIADSAVRSGPAEMKGAKLVALFNCRGQQNVDELKAKYPGAQLSATYSSSYASDDAHVLDALYDTIARRGDYASTRKALRAADLLQPKTNYMLPDDLRQAGFHDDDMDGIRDGGALGPDRFFDPGRKKAFGGTIDFEPVEHAEDVQSLSGVKTDHAVEYANTAFYYFSEENRAAPLANSKADTLVPGGWFDSDSDSDEPVRITAKPRDGKTWYEVSVSSRYASRSREVITAMVLYEVQKYFCEREGRFDADDKLRALVLVGGYLDLHADYSDTIDAVLAGFAKQYGFTGKVDYDFMYEAMKRDGEHGTATRKTLDYLKSHGIGVA